jgi:hypothetical protein
MKMLLILFPILFICNANAGSFLFQSTVDVNKAILIPRDLTKPTVVVSISKDCVDCGSYLKSFLLDFAQKNDERAELILTLDGGLWRKADEIYKKSAWLPQSLKNNAYHDPNGRFRASITSDQGIYLMLYDSKGVLQKKEKLSSSSSYNSLLNNIKK